MPRLLQRVAPAGHPVARTRLLPVHRGNAPFRIGRLPYPPRASPRLLHVSRLPATSARARSCARELRSGTCSSAWISSPPAAVRSTQPGADGRSAALGRRGGSCLEVGARAGGRLRRGLRTVLASLRGANRADVVFSTVDTVGIPLMLLARAGRLRPPLVYVAIGLPERLSQLRSDRMRRLYASALGSSCVRDRVQRVRSRRAEVLAGAGTASPHAVEFVPFGVDARLHAGSRARHRRRRLGRRRPAPRLRAPPARCGAHAHGQLSDRRER